MSRNRMYEPPTAAEQEAMCPDDRMWCDACGDELPDGDDPGQALGCYTVHHHCCDYLHYLVKVCGCGGCDERRIALIEFLIESRRAGGKWHDPIRKCGKERS